MSSGPPDPSEADGGRSVAGVDDGVDVLIVHERAAGLSDRLEREGFSVTAAPTVEDGLTQLDGGRIDCVVSGNRLPDDDGIGFLERVRDRDSALPFVLYADDGSEELASRAVSAGVSEYVSADGESGCVAGLVDRIADLVAEYRLQEYESFGFEAIETVHQGIGLLEDGEFVYVNRAYADVVGYEPADLVGEHWSFLIPGEYVDSFRDEVVPDPSGDGRWACETVYAGKDGERITVDHALTATEGGTLICLVREVTRDSDDGPVSAEDEFVDRLLDALDDLFYVFDAEGGIVRVNDRVVERTGYERAELGSMTATDVVAERHRERTERAIEETLETGGSTVELAVGTAGGEEISHEFRTRRLTDGEGAVIGLVGVGRDVSDRKHREAKLRRQAEQFEAFGSVLSHDLRNPLNVVTGRLELLRDDREHMVERHVDTIERAADRLETIIDDLSAVMKEGELVRDVEPVEVESAAQSAWDPLGTDDATLRVTDSRRIRADERALIRMFDNLLGNALEHGGADVAVTVGALPNGFYVEDDGPGIDPAERQDVFKPGYTTKETDSGFGLASVHQIALAHGWEIGITESEGGGARFEITDVEPAV